MPEYSFPRVTFNFNIGGYIYKVSYNTINKNPAHLKLIPPNIVADLCCQASSIYECQYDVYIDRDGKIFQHILNFLRNDDYIYIYEKLDEYIKEQIILELKYFELNVLVDKITKHINYEINKLRSICNLLLLGIVNNESYSEDTPSIKTTSHDLKKLFDAFNKYDADKYFIALLKNNSIGIYTINDLPCIPSHI